MARVVVVGGGASGLAAAALLEQHQIDYTLIEVKRQVGGSLTSRTQDGFVFDGARSVFDQALCEHPLIQAWGLGDALTQVEGGVVFGPGVQTFVQALSARVTGPRLMRMALSSIGELEGGSLALCMENGLMLNARALILALPARYAERIFYGYRTEITEHLLDFNYQRLMHLSLGYRTPPRLTPPPEAVIQQALTLDARGGTTIRVAVETPKTTLTDDEIRALCAVWQWPVPEAVFAHHWPEADPTTLYTSEYDAWRNTLMTLLPPRVALIGSDYVPTPLTPGITPLSQCLTQAQEAVNAVLSQL